MRAVIEIKHEDEEAVVNGDPDSSGVVGVRKHSPLYSCRGNVSSPARLDLCTFCRRLAR